MTDEQLMEIFKKYWATHASSEECVLLAMREAVEKGIENAFYKYTQQKHSNTFKKFREEYKKRELEDVRKYTKEHGLITWKEVEDEIIYLEYIKSL